VNYNQIKLPAVEASRTDVPPLALDLLWKKTEVLSIKCNIREQQSDEKNGMVDSSFITSFLQCRASAGFIMVAVINVG
jgi:hypothetical protein